MRLFWALAAGLTILGSSEVLAQELAPEGRGLLSKPAEMPAKLQGTPPPHPFEPDPSGGFSRTIFETDENPDFKLTIRDFAFPPDRQPHTVTLPSGAFLHLLSEPSGAEIAKAPLALHIGARTAMPAGAPLEVTNNSALAEVVRALIVEEK